MAECLHHGNFAPANFCCACTRQPLEAEAERLLGWLRFYEMHSDECPACDTHGDHLADCDLQRALDAREDQRA